MWCVTISMFYHSFYSASFRRWFPRDWNELPFHTTSYYERLRLCFSMEQRPFGSMVALKLNCQEKHMRTKYSLIHFTRTASKISRWNDSKRRWRKKRSFETDPRNQNRSLVQWIILYFLENVYLETTLESPVKLKR